MVTLFGKAKFPDFNDPELQLSLKPDVSTIFAKSKDPEELAHYWTAVRNNTGKKLRDMWIQKMEFEKEIARYVWTYIASYT